MKENLFNKNNRGFTLIEILISMSIFVLLVFAVSAIYVAFNNSQIRTTASQQLLNDSQYAFELMTREIKNNSIAKYNPDPTWCDGVFNYNNNSNIKYDNCIILKKDDGQVVAFTNYYIVSNPAAGVSLLYILLNNCDKNYSCDDWSDPYASAELLSIVKNDISVSNLDFIISPSVDPFVSGGPNEQPKVTIKMTTTNASSNQMKNVEHTFQTTVSSRIYKR